MIDKENEIYTRIRNAVLAKFENANISSRYIPMPASFPHVSCVQIDSFEPAELIDSSESQKYVSIAYQIDVYSNNKTKSKSECKDIIAVIDDTLRRMNFHRETLVPVQNINDASIYRITARYKVIADESNFYSI